MVINHSDGTGTGTLYLSNDIISLLEYYSVSGVSLCW